MGSIVATTADSGTLTSQQRYLPFGGERTDLGPQSSVTDLSYTGQRDMGMGLLDYKFRFYSPMLGRFISPDNITPDMTQGLNRYSYVTNNPIRFNDPTGHCIVYCTAEPPKTAAYQAIGLVINWFFELGKPNRTFGPKEPITQEVMKQKGVDDFRKEWAESGYEDGFTARTTIDDRNLPLVPRLAQWAKVFVQSHLIDLPLALMGDEDHSAIPGTIGSLDEISATYTDDGKVKIEVHNTMGWASGSRISTWSLIQNRDRNKFGPGGTTEQYFYWYEKIPKKTFNKIVEPR